MARSCLATCLLVSNGVGFSVCAVHGALICNRVFESLRLYLSIAIDPSTRQLPSLVSWTLPMSHLWGHWQGAPACRIAATNCDCTMHAGKSEQLDEPLAAAVEPRGKAGNTSRPATGLGAEELHELQKLHEFMPQLPSHLLNHPYARMSMKRGLKPHVRNPGKAGVPHVPAVPRPAPGPAWAKLISQLPQHPTLKCAGPSFSIFFDGVSQLTTTPTSVEMCKLSCVATPGGRSSTAISLHCSLGGRAVAVNGKPLQKKETKHLNGGDEVNFTLSCLTPTRGMSHSYVLQPLDVPAGKLQPKSQEKVRCPAMR